MNKADAAALTQALAMLPDDLAEVVQRLAAEPWQLREARRGRRDEAVRQAMRLLTGSATVRACELERRLRRYETSTDWQEDRFAGPPDDAPLLRHCLAEVMTHGRALRWRQIHTIARTDACSLQSKLEDIAEHSAP